ncbi:hypothetical protein BHE74_00014891 [Ensete ventricosum]|nr:hypothetical protein BHE74_00014891 [Ensete ventricosum]
MLPPVRESRAQYPPSGRNLFECAQSFLNVASLGMRVHKCIVLVPLVLLAIDIRSNSDQQLHNSQLNRGGDDADHSGCVWLYILPFRLAQTPLSLAVVVNKTRFLSGILSNSSLAETTAPALQHTTTICVQEKAFWSKMALAKERLPAGHSVEELVGDR